MTENPSLPTTIGRYEVRGILGSGAMGNVYLAEDPRIKRKLAIKVVKLDILKNEADRREFLARFQREAEVSGLLNHPGIVTVYDVGECELGPFLAMEYVKGRSLDELAKAVPDLALKEKLRIAAGVAEALDHAHAAGVIHRDVKPGNVMIAEDGRPKLMDFGIAKREDASLTQTGTFLGTPSYASPEQIREGTVTARSDGFSFGVLVFELLSGQSPFPGSSINTILYRIVNEPPVEIQPPVLGLLPGTWKRIFAKALAKEPEGRYSTCCAFLRELVEASSLSKADRQELLALFRHHDVPAITAIKPLGNEPVHATVRARRPKRSPLAWMVPLLAVLVGGGGFLLFRNWGGEQVLLSAQPADAKVMKNGKELGKVPYPLTMRPGERVRLERKGFKSMDFQFSTGNTAPSLVLEPIISEEMIRSLPEGANVTLDGQKLAGVTPLKVRWNQGQKVDMTLSKGDLSCSRTFNEGETPGRETFALVASGAEPDSSGFLRHTASYAVHVKCDGQELGELQPGGKLTIAPGVHKLELVNGKVFFRESRSLTVAPGQTVSLSLPSLVRLTVDTFPTYDKVVIDGQKTAVDSDGGGAISLVSGRHTLAIHGHGASRTVDLKGDQRLRFRI